MYQFAQVIIPFANPDDKKEAKKHFWVLFWYSWGFQYPFWVVTDHAGRQIEQRISGKFIKPYGAPGMICADSHHAIGITAGYEFSRVAGPGIAFTDRYERPFKIIDLRTQVRNREIQALTKDGVQFKVRLAAAFSVDREDWSPELYNNLSKSNPGLKDAMNTDHAIGVYPFSSKRIREVIAFGAKNSPVDTEFPETNWDDLILNKIEPIASQVLSQRDLNELWTPRNTAEGSCATAEISEEIFNKAHDRLRKRGIRLYASRIVDFRFTKDDGTDDDEIPKQQLEVWSTHWKNKARQIIEEAKSTAALEEKKVRAEITRARFEILKEVRDPEVARKLAALRIVTAVENLDKREPNHPSQSENDTSQKDDGLEPRIKKYVEKILPEIVLQMKAILAKEKEEKK